VKRLTQVLNFEDKGSTMKLLAELQGLPKLFIRVFPKDFSIINVILT
jgi:hypothetical protein